MSSQMIIQIKQKQDDKSFKLYQNPVFIRNTVLSATNMDQSIVDVGIGHFFSSHRPGTLKPRDP